MDVRLPDGTVIRGVPDGITQSELAKTLQRNGFQVPAEWLASEPQEKAKGFSGALRSGIEGLASNYRTAFGAATGDATEAARAGAERGKDINSRFENEVDFSRVTEKFKDPKGGILPAAGELLKQSALATTQQLPNLLTTAAGAKVGAMAGAPLGPIGAGAGAIIGAAAPTALQLFGANLERQAEENPSAPVDAGTAALTAVSQTALETAATFFTLGKGVVGKVLGPEVAAAIGKANGKAVESLAKQGLARTLAGGAARGVASEVPTEVLQLMMERAQAGLDLTSPDAIAEYGRTAYQAGLAGAPMGSVGRVVERGDARTQVENAAAAKRAEERKTEEERRNSPEYALETAKKYKELQAQYDQMSAALVKPPKGNKDEALTQKFKEDSKKLRDFQEKLLQPAAAEYNRTKGNLPPEAAAQTATQAQQPRSMEDFLQDHYGKDVIPAGPEQESTWMTGDQEVSQPPAVDPNLVAAGRDAEGAVDTMYQQTLSPEEYAFDRENVRDRAKESDIRVKAAVDTLMEAPDAARAVLDGKGKLVIPGLTPQDSYAIYQELLSRVKGEIAGQLEGMPGKAKREPKTPQWMQDAADQYTDAEVEAARQQRQAKNQLWRKVFEGDTAQEPGTPSEAIDATAKALMGESPGNVLSDAIVRDAEGNILPQRDIYGAKSSVTGKTVGEIKESLRDLLRKRESMRRGMLVQRRDEGYIRLDDTEEGQRLLGEIAQHIEVLRELKESGAKEYFSREIDSGEFSDPIRTREAKTDTRVPEFKAPDVRRSPERKQLFLSDKETQTDPVRADIRRLENALQQNTLSDATRVRIEAEIARLRSGVSAAETAVAGLNARVQQLRTRGNLTPAAQNFLERIEQALPGLQNNRSALTSISEQLGRIERGVDGQQAIKSETRVPAGARAPETVNVSNDESPWGRQEVTPKATQVKNLRRAKTQAPETELSLEQDVEEAQRPLLEGGIEELSEEYAPGTGPGKANTTPVVSELFPETKATLRSTPKAFQKFLASTKAAEQRAKTVPALLKQITALRDRLIAAYMPETRLEPLPGEAAEKARERAKAEVEKAVNKLLPLVPQRMELQGLVQELERQIPLLEKQYAAEARISSLEDTPGELHPLAKQLLKAKQTLENALPELQAVETLLASLDNYITLNRSIGTVEVTEKVSEAERNRLKKALADAQKAVDALRAAEPKRKPTGPKKQEWAVPEEMLAETQSRLTLTPEEKAAKLEAQRRVDEKTDSTRVEAIDETQRAIREGAVVPEQDKKKKNPYRTKGQLMRQYNALLDEIRTAEAAADKTKRRLERNKELLEKQLAAYKEAKSADARDAIGKQIDETNTRIRELQEKAKSSVHDAYVGKADHLKRKAKLEVELEAVEQDIEDFRAAKALRDAERTSLKRFVAKIRKTPAQSTPESKAAAQAEAERTSSAPKIDTPIETQSQINKARKSKKTLFTPAFGRDEKAASLDRSERQGKEYARLQQKRDVGRIGKELQKAFPDYKDYQQTGVLEIYPRVDDAIKAHPELEGKVKSDDGAFVLNGKAYLIAENLPEGSVLSKVLHDVGAHIGMRNAFNASEYKALYNAVKQWAKRDDGSVESVIGKRVAERLKAAKVSKEDIMDETIGYAVEESVAQGVLPTAGTGQAKSWLRKVVKSFRKALSAFGLAPKSITSQQLVDMAYGFARLELKGDRLPRTDTVGDKGTVLFSRGNTKYSKGLEDIEALNKRFVAQDKPLHEKLFNNLLGLNFRTQFVDSAAPLEAASRLMDPLKGAQMMYNIRMFGQKNNFVSQAAVRGAPELRKITRKDGQTEYLVEAKDNASLKEVADTLKPATEKFGSADAASQSFTMYMAAKRVFGLDKRGKDGMEIFAGHDTDLTRDDLREYLKKFDAMGVTKDFEAAARVYNEYNKGLINFAVDTGFLSRKLANQLLETEDYVPFYRERGGAVELVIGSETPVRIGNLKDAPHLKELVGSNNRIFDWMFSAVQNTSLLMDASLRNLATKNAVFELQEIGGATITKNDKLQGTDIVHFFEHGVEKAARIHTETFGIPADLLVKGLGGIPTMLPTAIRAMAWPASVLRRAVTLNPLYVARQLFRDSIASTLTTGANMTPVMSALKKWGDRSIPLEERGVVGGQVFTGTNEDITKILREITAGDSKGVNTLLARAEALAMEADASTRRAMFESFREQGLSEMEATLLSLESMNFNKRGVSPSVHFVSTLIPFFNAQIQGLDVLYKAFRGRMPFNERLKTREKLVARGALIVANTMTYAALMQDDEAYKNADPETKYNNWFVRVPGVDQPVRLPIPFELGYIFKALPEAVFNTLMTDADKNKQHAEDARAAWMNIAKQLVPGGTSYMLPQAVKPLIEAGMNKNLFSGKPIESGYERSLMPEYRQRDNTSEVSKELGAMLGVSPIMLDHLIRGYTAGMGLALVQSLGLAWPNDGPEAAVRRMSDMPVIGPFFQPNDAQGIVSSVYDKMNEVKQVKKTFDDMVANGRRSDAQEFLKANMDKLVQAEVAGNFMTVMGELTKAEVAIKNSTQHTPQEKREILDRIRAARIQMAKSVREMAAAKT